MILLRPLSRWERAGVRGRTEHPRVVVHFAFRHCNAFYLLSFSSLCYTFSVQMGNCTPYPNRYFRVRRNTFQGGSIVKVLKYSVICLCLLALVGCGTIYTRRDLGPVTGTVRLTDGLTMDKAISTLGVPDVIQEMDGGKTICAYRTLSYKNILGVYVVSDESDYTLTFSNGRLTDQEWTKTGESMSICSFQTYSLGVDAD